MPDRAPLSPAGRSSAMVKAIDEPEPRTREWALRVAGP